MLKLYHIINEVGFPIQGVDPVVMKYAGLSREVVNIAVANYGDNPTKLHLSYFHLSHSIHVFRDQPLCFGDIHSLQFQEFANGFTALREMGGGSQRTLLQMLSSCLRMILRKHCHICSHGSS